MTANNRAHEHTIAFYNIENLFDTENDPLTNDDDFLPQARKRWTEKRYLNKLKKIGSVIAAIGNGDQTPPAIIGLAEVENKKVLKDLLKHSVLESSHYNYVHFDSADERGIDVALLYDKNLFTISDSQSLVVNLIDNDGRPDYTRDILYVSGSLSGQPLHLFVNHWSSRREGQEATEYKRLLASERLLAKINEIAHDDPGAAIIVMGDFNDNPNNRSVTNLETDGALFNPFKTLWSPHSQGSLNHKFEWNLFDQILFSHHILDINASALQFVTADIFDERFVTKYKGKFKGQPFRTYVGKKYLGGYSDHFPVYITFKLHQ